MSHRVHPKVFRIKEISNWNSRGFYGKDLSKYLKEDFKIREFLRKKLANTGLEKIEIERFSGKLNIIILSARPGLIIGRRGEGVEVLKKEIEKILEENPNSKKREIRIEIREVKDPWLSATLVSKWIAQQIKKRVPYQRVLKKALDKIMSHKSVKGARVEVAGRLNGAEIARTAWLKKGRLPRQTLRAVIDYATARAHCTYGVIGVKVWIYKGEKFD